MYEVSKLEFSYGNRKVFQGFSMKLSDPFSGIIGINGAGKTTLVKLSLGLLRPEKGKILVNGVNLTEHEDRRRVSLGVLFEHARFPDWTKVFSYLRWVGQMRGFSKKKAGEQAREVLLALGLDDRMDSYVKELSAGLKQRFGIAQAFIGLPDLVFLDEPTANLDAISRVRILEFIKEITEQHGIQVILFSHILSDLEKYCDSVAILHDGALRYQSTMRELFQRFYVKEFVIRFSINQDKIVEEIVQRYDVEVLNQKRGEVIVRTESQVTSRELMKELASNMITMSPYKSVLEQVFEDTVLKEESRPRVHAS